MTADEEIVFNAIDDFIQLQGQGQAPSPEEYVKSYPVALRAELLNALHHVPSVDEQQQAWDKVQNRIEKEGNTK
jgi:uncharacterized protein (DUF1919 family)